MPRATPINGSSVELTNPEKRHLRSLVRLRMLTSVTLAETDDVITDFLGLHHLDTALLDRLANKCDVTDEEIDETVRLLFATQRTKTR